MERKNSISYSFEDIRRYRQGLMSKSEMHAFEKASMEDPFLSDALDGYMESDMALADEHLQNITQKINNKEQKNEGAVVVTMPKRSFGMWRVAAMVIIIAGAGLLTYKVLDKKDAVTDPIATVPKETVTPSETTSSPSAQQQVEAQQQNGAIAKGNEVSGSVSQTNTFSKPAEHTETDAPTVVVNKDKIAAKEARVEDVKVAKDHTAAEETTAAATKPAAPGKSDPTDVGRRLDANISNEFRGTIVTPTNEPLANTDLRIENSNKKIVTDNAGNFLVNAPDTVLNATITSGDFTNRRVKLRANAANNINLGTITMKQDEEFEKTVTIVGLGSKRVKVADTTFNKPVGGWESFQDYVAKTLGLPVDTTTTDDSDIKVAEIEFIVDNNGTPKNIKVLTITDAAKAKQLVNAIRNGPKWASPNKTTRLLIKY